MKVKKRKGNLEELQLDKFHQMIEWMTKDLANVSASEIEINTSLQLFDGIESKSMHKMATKSAADLISLRHPNYQYAAARGLLMEIRKEVFGTFEPASLVDTAKKNITEGFYEDIFKYYTEEEVGYYDSKINHDKDFSFTYCGLVTVLDKYIVKNKKDQIYLESPQQLNMLVAMMAFKEDPKRDNEVVKYYNDLSDFKISLPSPLMSGLRTPVKGYASCCLIDTGDTTPSLTAANSAAVKMTTIKAGIGLHTGKIRGLGASVKNGTVVHTGVTPLLRWYEGAVKAFSQGSRGGGATTYHAFWNWEIEKILTLKSNKSTPENSVKKLDYGIGFNRLFFERASKNEDITLFSSEDTPELYEFLNDYNRWESAYLRYEKDTGIRKKKVSAKKILESFATQWFETGRYYPLFLDNANRGPFTSPIIMSNLCAEILLPVKPLKSVDDPEGEVALCILSNVNAGKIKSLDELPRLGRLLVRSLDNLIDYQDYPLPAAENPTVNGRYLGIGVSDWAHYLTKKKVRYDSEDARDLAEEFMEHWQFNLLTASMELAKERGEAAWFRERSKYVKGWLPNDGRWRFISHEKWEDLRANIIKYGLRNLVLSAIPPAGTSSDVSNSTSGIDIPRDLIVTKKTSMGNARQIVPNFSKGSSYYTLATELENEEYHKMIAKFQLYTDQSISTNVYWSKAKDFVEVDGVPKMPMKKIISALVNAWSLGLKTLYYSTFIDEENQEADAPEDSCDGGGCSV